jgi:hypothetical protein
VADVAALSPPLIQALRAIRDDLNRRVAQRRADERGFDAGAFNDLLCGPVDAAASAVSAIAPEHVAVAVDALVDAALDLAASGKAPAERDVALSLLAASPRMLALDPRRAIAAANAVIELPRAGVDASQWVRRMKAAATSARDVDTWLDAGCLAAWSLGLAHARNAALMALGRLDDETALSALGLGAGTATRNALMEGFKNPWWRPDSPPRKPCVVARLGGFVAFGGQFMRPPRAIADEQGVVVGDGERWFRAHADAYGATLTATDAPSGSATVSEKLPQEVAQRHPALRAPSSSARWGHLLVVTIAMSHRAAVIAA